MQINYETLHFLNVPVKSTLLNSHVAPEEMPVFKRKTFQPLNRCGQMLAVLIISFKTSAVGNAVPHPYKRFKIFYRLVAF